MLSQAYDGRLTIRLFLTSHLSNVATATSPDSVST